MCFRSGEQHLTFPDAPGRPNVGDVMVKLYVLRVPLSKTCILIGTIARRLVASLRVLEMGCGILLPTC